MSSRRVPIRAGSQWGGRSVRYGGGRKHAFTCSTPHLDKALSLFLFFVILPLSPAHFRLLKHQRSQEAVQPPAGSSQFPFAHNQDVPTRRQRPNGVGPWFRWKRAARVGRRGPVRFHARCRQHPGQDIRADGALHAATLNQNHAVAQKVLSPFLYRMPSNQRRLHQSSEVMIDPCRDAS